MFSAVLEVDFQGKKPYSVSLAQARSRTRAHRLTDSYANHCTATTSVFGSCSHRSNRSPQGRVDRQEPAQGYPSRNPLRTARGHQFCPPLSDIPHVVPPELRRCWFCPDVTQSEAAPSAAQLPGQRRRSRRVPGVRRLRCPPRPPLPGPRPGHGASRVRRRRPRGRPAQLVLHAAPR